jgi:uncharacterized protein YjbI with pentapeptide repeats
MKLKTFIIKIYNFYNIMSRQNLRIGPGAHLEGAHLEGANLRGAHLEGANLRNAYLEGAYLEEAHLEGANLEEAYLRDAHLEGAYLTDAYLTDIDLEGAHLEGAHLEGAHLSGVNLRTVFLRGIHLEGANLQFADLEEVDFREAHLEGAYLEQAQLDEANLDRAHLEGAHLEGAFLREAHLERAHLKGTHLEGAHLEGAFLRKADLSEANLSEANLTNAVLEGAHLERAHLREANLTGANLRRIHIEGADLSEANLTGAYLEGAHLEREHLEGVILSGAHLEGTHLEGAHLERANFRETNLTGTYLEGANLEGAFFEGADLREAHLEEADLKLANLSFSYLIGTHLERAHLEGAYFQGANLTGAHLEGAHLEGANFEGANLTGVTLSDIQREQIAASALDRKQRREKNAASRLANQQRRSALANQQRRTALVNQRIRTILANQQRRTILSNQQRRAQCSESVFDIQQRPYSDCQIITIPRQLHFTLRDFGIGSSKSCPDFKHLYQFIMAQELTENFRFKFEGQSATDLTGLTRIVFDKILPVYIDLFFKTTNKLILLKENVDIQILNLNTLQLIKLAKAAHSQIVLQIHPAVLELLLKENPKESIATRQNFSNLYKNFKNQISKMNGVNISNYLMNKSLKPTINAARGNLDALNEDIKAEILFRKTLSDFGFTSWEQYHNMALFIKRFWNTSNDNKVTITKNRSQVEVDLFVLNLKFDIESFKRRLKFITSEGINIDLKEISAQILESYPALRPLLQYIFDESSDENRRTFAKYCAGTEYYPGELRILLSRQQMSPELYNGSPFYGHTCDTRVDLFRAPSGFNREITVNAINIALKANTSSLAASE